MAAFAYHETAEDAWTAVKVAAAVVVVATAVVAACGAVAFRMVVVAVGEASAWTGVGSTGFHHAYFQREAACCPQATAAFRREASPSEDGTTGAHSSAEVGDAAAFVRAVRGVPKMGDVPAAVVPRQDSHSEVHPDHRTEPSF